MIKNLKAKNKMDNNLTSIICKFLEDHKIFDIVSIDLAGKSSMADALVIASGRSQKHISMVGEMLKSELHHSGVKTVAVEGLPSSDWILIDAGSVVVHLFRPEVRTLYNLEKMWGADFGKEVKVVG